MSKANTSHALLSALAVSATLAVSSTLLAAPLDPPDDSPRISGPPVGASPDDAGSESDTASGAPSAEESLALPYTLSPRINRAAAFARVVAGYDGAVESAVARSAAEARVLSFLSVRVDYEHGPGMGPDDRLGFGARAQLLNAEDHGIDAGVGLFYQPNDFREEGHVAAALMLGRYFGRMGVFANAQFGADPEADDAAFEGRLAALYRASDALRVGWDTRIRYNMSEDEKRAGTLARDWELQSLPSLSYSIGSVSFVAEAGLSALQQTGPFGTDQEETTTDLGVVALAGAGGAF